MVNFDDFCLWEDHLIIDYNVDEENRCKDQGRYIRDDILMNQEIISKLKDHIRTLKRITTEEPTTIETKIIYQAEIGNLEKILEEEK